MVCKREECLELFVERLSRTVKNHVSEIFLRKKEYNKQRRPSRLYLSSFPTTYIYGRTGPCIDVSLWYLFYVREESFT